ncbi:hypothetical protein EV126DRAFT_184946 [Verticillium dahliae]|nr:hypothetical protein EV126DRAFT_184946 [Verticillium dahliae]
MRARGEPLSPLIYRCASGASTAMRLDAIDSPVPLAQRNIHPAKRDIHPSSPACPAGLAPSSPAALQGAIHASHRDAAAVKAVVLVSSPSHPWPWSSTPGQPVVSRQWACLAYTDAAITLPASLSYCLVSGLRAASCGWSAKKHAYTLSVVIDGPASRQHAAESRDWLRGSFPVSQPTIAQPTTSCRPPLPLPFSPHMPRARITEKGHLPPVSHVSLPFSPLFSVFDTQFIRSCCHSLDI